MSLDRSITPARKFHTRTRSAKEAPPSLALFGVRRLFRRFLSFFSLESSVPPRKKERKGKKAAEKRRTPKSATSKLAHRVDLILFAAGVIGRDQGRLFSDCYTAQKDSEQSLSW
jgi:hypothetical protein